MDSIDFLNFLYKSKDTVSIDLLAMNLIILKKPYQSRKILLNPYKKFCEKDKVYKIQGTVWFESKHKETGLEVRIKERTSEMFTIKSDICKNLYKYYYRGNAEYPSLIHV